MQAFNPFLPPWEYVPDGEPHVIGDRVYLFGSHDRFGGNYYCEEDYVCWSAPVGDLGNWRCEGVIYHKEQDPLYGKENGFLFAPDVVQGKNGKWYLYYTLGTNGIISVAVCGSPAGKYEYLGMLRAEDGHVLGTRDGDAFPFDPALLEDNGRIFLYSGFSPRSDEGKKRFGKRIWKGAYCYELEEDMLTVKGAPILVARGASSAEGTSFRTHPFFEASSVRKIKGKYYFVYSSVYGHELCWAVSDFPDRGFEYGGVLVSNGDEDENGKFYNYTGNNHGGMAEIGGQWYIFYHRHTNRSSFSRQACAEKIFFDREGNLSRAELTSCGLNAGALTGEGDYPARIACMLYGKNGATGSALATEEDPYFTQDESAEQYVSNLRDGAVVGFKYFDFCGQTEICVTVRGTARGRLMVLAAPSREHSAEIAIEPSREWKTFGGATVSGRGTTALRFAYQGEGALDFLSFSLKKK